MLKIGVLISGRGSNLQSLVNDIQYGAPYEIACVLANKDCAGLQIAKDNKIPYAVVRYKDHDSKESAESMLDTYLRMFNVQLVVLAGFMRVLSPTFVSKWPDKVINIHPSLLPSFPGLHVHEQAISYGVKYSGCTVHFVTPKLDDGPIIGQSVVPVLDTDTVESLATRILVEEHMLLPKCIRLIANDQIETIENRVLRKDGVSDLLFN
jgi:phosphoribosylglycinamide formyltransferase-1